MTKPSIAITTEKVLGWVGLFLLIVIAALANQACRPRPTRAGRLSAWIARRGIDLVATIGWLVDHLPGPAVTPVRVQRKTGTAIAARG